MAFAYFEACCGIPAGCRWMYAATSSRAQRLSFGGAWRWRREAGRFHKHVAGVPARDSHMWAMSSMVSSAPMVYPQNGIESSMSSNPEPGVPVGAGAPARAVEPLAGAVRRVALVLACALLAVLTLVQHPHLVGLDFGGVVIHAVLCL